MRRVITQDMTDVISGYDSSTSLFNSNTNNQLFHLFGVDPVSSPSYGWYGQMQIYPNIFNSWGICAAMFKRYKTKFIKIRWIPKLGNGAWIGSTATIGNITYPRVGDGINNLIDNEYIDVPVIAYRFTTQADSSLRDAGYNVSAPNEMVEAFDAIVGCGDAKIRRLDRPFSIVIPKPRFRQGIDVQGHSNPSSETYRGMVFSNSKYLPTSTGSSSGNNDYPGGTVAWGFVEYAIKNGPRYYGPDAVWRAGALGQYGQFVVTAGFSLIDAYSAPDT